MLANIKFDIIATPYSKIEIRAILKNIVKSIFLSNFIDRASAIIIKFIYDNIYPTFSSPLTNY
jgi:hypothetical protein